LLIGATGGIDRGVTNHYFPDPLTTPNQPKKELFPGNWKEKVLKSDIGIAAVVGAVLALTVSGHGAQTMALYGMPLVVVNAWLVTYTWLQHTDTDVPHFDQSNHNFIKGALHTIDRPYNKMDPFGIIDFLHHQIGTTHVAHHFDSTIPHYKAQIATDAIKENFPEYYMYDPTPIPEALWRVAKGCTAVEKRGDRWIWKNEGVEDLI
jgi:fatty acid desaturase